MWFPKDSVSGYQMAGTKGSKTRTFFSGFQIAKTKWLPKKTTIWRIPECFLNGRNFIVKCFMTFYIQWTSEKRTVQYSNGNFSDTICVRLSNGCHLVLEWSTNLDLFIYKRLIKTIFFCTRRSKLANGPIPAKKGHSNTGLVRSLDPHCMYMYQIIFLTLKMGVPNLHIYNPQSKQGFII
jgi:hypothetical protein